MLTAFAWAARQISVRPSIKMNLAFSSINRRRVPSTVSDVAPLLSAITYFRGRPSTPPASLISCTANVWMAMQGRVPGESTIPAYPITIGSPDGSALTPVDAKQSVSVITVTINRSNLNLLHIAFPPFLVACFFIIASTSCDNEIMCDQQDNSQDVCRA